MGGSEWWYGSAALCLSSATTCKASSEPASASSGASSGSTITDGCYVTVVAGFPADGPLKPGRFGLVVKDDKSDQPFNVCGGLGP